jgi:hypothetical protein
MGLKSRRKGKVYEREVCAEVNAALRLKGGNEVGRNLGQERDSGNDITLTKPEPMKGRYVIEAKRRQQLSSLYRWLDQAREAARSPSDTPIVVTRQDNRESIAILPFTELLRLLADERVAANIINTIPPDAPPSVTSSP